MPGLAALIVLIFVFAIAVAILSTRAVRMQWAGAADRLGIVLESATLGHGRLAGDVEGFPVLVDVKGGGNNARTRYRLTCPPLIDPFHLQREAGTQRILRMVGIQDVQVGDAEFDAAFDVKTDAPESLAAWLTPARRFSLLRLVAAHRSLDVTETSMEVTTRGIERSGDRIEATVRRLVATAQHLVGTAATPALDSAIAARAAGDLGESIDRMDAILAEHPEDLDTQVLQADGALAAGDADRFTTAAAVVGSSLPSDPEFEALRAAAARSSQPPEQPAETAAAREPAGEDDSMAMLHDIFGTDRLSFETEETFAATYRGRTVRWTGRVKSTRTYDQDLDFGKGPGTKAVITVASIESDLYGNTEIDAVVALPAAPGAPLARGDTVSFAGTLDKADAMMRNVFVRDGRLVPG